MIIFLAAALLSSCTRDESGSPEKKPIESAFLPTPKTTIRVAEAMTPIVAHTAAAPSVSPTAARPAIAPTVPAVDATKTPKAPEPPTVARKGVVAKGTDLLAGPSADAQVRGTFQGRTEVDVFESDGGYARVKAPVIGGGGAVEGWVASASIKAPGEKPAQVTKSGKPEKTTPAPAGDAGKLAGTGKAAPPKPATAVPPKPGGDDKGPSDILLKALAGMVAKRPGTPFTHKKHYDDYGVKCIDCHHAVKAKGGTVPATKTCGEAGCHLAEQCDGQTVPKKNKPCPAFEDAYHTNCIECHRAQSGPTKCAECHTP